MSTSSRESPARITRGTQRCVFLQRWIKSAVLACLCYGSAAGGANLFTDPTFREIHELSLMPPPRGWYWQRIQTPCRVMASPAQRSVTLEGGKVFLDSVPAELSPSTQHDFALQVSGTATFSVEFLHWTRRGLPAQPHRILLHKPAPLTATPLTIRVTFRSPPEISLGQLRLIAEQGTAVVSAPSLAISAGKLLLSLDAAQPGPRPGTHWQDLTRLNRDFVLSKGVRHVAETKSYVFDAPGARCRGALEDAAHFNFETDVAAGPGQGDPFTGVFYAKLTDGLSGSGIINKLGDLKRGGWALGLVMDEFGLDRVTTLQQSNQQLRTINGFPGIAGQNDKRLNVKDGRFHLFVAHLTGSGHRDGTVYIDGGTHPLTLTAWPFGSLSSGSTRNSAALCIGAFGDHGFRGEIGFVEIWAGTRLEKGMTPATYSRVRYRASTPRRGS